MSVPSRRRAVAATSTVLALLLALLSTACARGLESDTHVASLRLEPLDQAAAEGAGAADLRLPVVRTKKKADGTAFGFVRANRRLYPPFDVSFTAGLVPGEPQDGFSGNAQLCLELDERATISEDLGTLQFVLLCARRVDGGLLVEAKDVFDVLGDVFLPETDAAVLRARHDGSDLVFETAAAVLGEDVAEGALVEVARIEDYSPSTPGDALVPSMGAAGLAHPASIAFDALRMTTSDPDARGAVLSEEQALALQVGTALDATVEVLHALNGVPDPTDAADLLLDASALTEGVLLDLERATPSKAGKKARGALAKALKQAAGALALLDAAAPVPKASKKVLKVARLQLKAIDLLDPLGG